MNISMKNAVRRASGALALAVIAAASLLSVMTAHAANTSDDCFGGALSQDPLHCYVLEQAHNEGIIEVDAVYQSSKTLYLFLIGDEFPEIDSEEYSYFRTKAQEEVSRNGGDQCVLDQSGCKSGVFAMRTGFILPESQTYLAIKFWPVGRGGLHTRPGWASYRQWWPSAAEPNTQRRGVRGQTQPSTGFDVSDVDLGNFSPVDCSNYASNTNGCQLSKFHPGIGMAGWHGNGEKLYVQVKAPNGETSKIEAARQALIEENPRGLNENNLVIIPVNHDYQDLSHYAELLNRFALSAGNTLGIVGARIGINRTGGYQGTVIYPLTELTEVEPGDTAGHRETVHLWTRDLQGTVDALPQLLPQLGIPADALGVVVQARERAERIAIPLRSEATHTTVAQGAAQETPSGQIESSTWIIAGSAGLALALLVLVTVFLWRKRLAKRESTQ